MVVSLSSPEAFLLLTQNNLDQGSAMESLESFLHLLPGGHSHCSLCGENLCQTNHRHFKCNRNTAQSGLNNKETHSLTRGEVQLQSCSVQRPHGITELQVPPLPQRLPVHMLLVCLLLCRRQMAPGVLVSPTGPDNVLLGTYAGLFLHPSDQELYTRPDLIGSNPWQKKQEFPNSEVRGTASFNGSQMIVLLTEQGKWMLALASGSVFSTGYSITRRERLGGSSKLLPPNH